VGVATDPWLGCAERWVRDDPVIVLPGCMVLAKNPAAAHATMMGNEM
jgi:hypothetical protein